MLRREIVLEKYSLDITMFAFSIICLVSVFFKVYIIYKYAAPRRNLNPLRDTPWRRFADGIWTPEAYDTMLEDLLKSFPGSEDVTKANIVLIGPVGHGKSLFISSILSIGSISVTEPAASGSAAHSYTTRLGVYDGDCAKVGNVRLFDTMGLEHVESEGFNVNDITLLLKGHIKKNYRFDPRHPISKSHRSYVARPTPADKSHLVVFCVDATSLTIIPRETERKIALLQDKIKDMGIPRMLILTKIDQVCQEVAKDITKLYHSIAVEEAVEKAGELFQMTRSYIHPVENYHSTPRTNKQSNVPLMFALQQMLDVSREYFRRTDTYGDDDASDGDNVPTTPTTTREAAGGDSGCDVL